MKQIILKYQDFLNEANRGNYYPNFKEEFYKFVNMYKGQEDLIFLSFKSSDKFVSKINMKYHYSNETPQGIYTYPYKNYTENLIDKDTSFINVPYAKHKDFLYVYKLKSLDGFLTFQNESDYPKALEILERIKKDYGYSDTYIRSFKSKIKKKFEDYEFDSNFDSKNPISVLYTFITYKVSEKSFKLQRNEFLKYGIKGFVDINGGFIHANEPTQSVIFDISCIEDYKIIDRRKYIIQKYKTLTPLEKRILGNPKTDEDFEYISKYYDLDIDFSKLKKDSDGLYIYDGDIVLKHQMFIEAPKFLQLFKRIGGELSFRICEKLEVLDSLRNLEYVGQLIFVRCNIKNLEGLGSLRRVRDIDIIVCHSFKSCDGLRDDFVIDNKYPKEFEDMFIKYKQA